MEKDNKKTPSLTGESNNYLTPTMDVIYIEMEQNILQSSANGNGNSIDIPYKEGWWN